MGSVKVKSLKKGAIVTIFFLTVVLVLAACSSPTDEAPEEFFTVSFAANGGYPEPEALLVPKGGLIAMPEDMTRNGNKFDAWYKDADCTAKWDFERDVVTGDVTLYAKWNPSSRGGGGGGGGGGVSGGAPVSGGTPVSGGGAPVTGISLTIGTPSAIAYSNNHNGRNALTPIYSEEAPHSAASPYTERTATFTVAVSGFSSDSDANNVGLVISAVPGLSFSGHDATGNASSGTKTFTVTITLLDTVAFGTGSASINITGLSTGGISGVPGGYVCTDTRSTAASIIDGRDISRAIPLYQANINEFNTYANTTEGLTRHYKLTEDVTLPTVLPGESNWEAIGTFPTAQFTGSFDGQNHTISNLTTYASGNSQGMFGRINGDGITRGIVKNVGLISGSINGNDFVGGVVGLNNGTVENCYSTGDMSGDRIVGGIAGWNIGTVVNCYSTGDVIGSNDNVGGVVGLNIGTVENCYSTGDVSGFGRVGGVVGDNGGTVENCVALNQAITSTSGGYLEFGRVVGFNNGSFGAGNHARSNMKFIDGPTSTPFTPSPPVISDLNGIHGEDVVVGASVALDSVFSAGRGWDPAVWDVPTGVNFDVGGVLPTLNNMPAGVQDPRIQ